MLRSRLATAILLAASLAVTAKAVTGDDLAGFALVPDLSDGPIEVRIRAAGGGVQGWSFGVCHDPGLAELRWFRESSELLTIRSGRSPAFLITEEAFGSAGASGVVQAVVLDYLEHVVLPVDAGGFPVLEAEYETDAEEVPITICGGLRGSGEPVPLGITLDGATLRPTSSAMATLVPKPGAWFDIRPAISNGPVTVYIHSVEGGIQGWSLSVCHDDEKAEVVRFDSTVELATVRHGERPDFLFVEEAHDSTQSGVIQATVPAFAEEVSLPGETDGGFPALEIEYDVLEETTITFCEGLQGAGQPVALVVTIGGLSSRLPMQHAATTLIVDPYASTLAYRVEPLETSDVATVKLYSGTAAVEAWSFTLCHSRASADLVEIATSPELEQIVFGEAPDFVFESIEDLDSVVAVSQQVVVGSSTPSGSTPLAVGPFHEGLSLLDLRYDVHSDETLKFCDHVGTVDFENHVTIGGVRYVPRTREGATLVAGALGSRFIRGDVNVDGRVQLTDPILILGYLFLGYGALPCLDAADANDVARIEISDAIYLLRFLFLGGPPPPPPFTAPGTDISPETALGCERGI